MIFDYLINKYFNTFSSKKIEFNSAVFFSNSEIEIVLNLMNAENYFLIENNKIVWKKKKYKFIGKILPKKKYEAVSFLRDIVYPDWCRSFYLMPDDGTSKAIFIDEEGCFTLIEPIKNVQ